MNWTLLGYFVENKTFEFVGFARIRFTFLSAVCLFNVTVGGKTIIFLNKTLRQHIFSLVMNLKYIHGVCETACVCLEEDWRGGFRGARGMKQCFFI